MEDFYKEDVGEHVNYKFDFSKLDKLDMSQDEKTFKNIVIKIMEFYTNVSGQITSFTKEGMVEDLEVAQSAQKKLMYAMKYLLKVLQY